MFKTKKSNILIILALLISCDQNANNSYYFSKEQKEASKFTQEKNQSYYHFLDFADSSAFERVDKGFIAPLINNGNIEGVFNAKGFNFMQGKEAPSTVNPSLWRHAQLVNRGGLYKVTDHIYQVRGQDLVNLTIIETQNGIILYDVEYTSVTLLNSIKLYEEHRGKKELKGVIISHSHADHFGGFNGIYDAGLAVPEDFKSGRIPLIAPLNFVEKSVSENVMAGNIMARRAGYQYGNVLSPGEKGLITGALGAAVANGASSLPIPNKIISKKEGESVIIDGLKFDFYFTPSAEAPAEMVFYIPEWKALSMAEEVNHLQHNIYTLRGAETRDSKVWASYIADAIVRFGDEVEVQFGPHTWPVWGNKEVVSYLKDQRDLYQSIYNTALRYANYGYKPDDIAEFAELPKSVFNSWNNRPYYGQTSNNLKSTYIKNLGWYNANPTELAKHSNAERGKRYVKSLGGESAVLQKALGFFNEGDYRFCVDLLNNIVSYNGSNEKVNYLMADAFEQLGYQQENALYRNWYLSAANELRVNGNVPSNFNTTSPEVIANLPTDLLMDYLGMLVDQIKAENNGNYSIGLQLTNESPYKIELHNGVFIALKNNSYKDVDTYISISKKDFINFLYGNLDLQNSIASDKIKMEGDINNLMKLKNVIDLNIKNDMNLILPLQKEFIIN